MSLPFHFVGYAGRLADAGAAIPRQRFRQPPANLSDQPAHAAAERDMARRMLNWRMAFNRRELTGIRLQDGTQIHAARSRRIV